jgi:primosomal protein N' (replication factor Y)
MYVLVRLLNRFARPLTYVVPPELADSVKKGTIVQVPLRNHHYSALVVLVQETIKKTPYKILPIAGLFSMPKDEQFTLFIERLAQFYFTDTMALYSRLASFVSHEPKERDEEAIAAESVDPVAAHATLTDEQKDAVAAVWQGAQKQQYFPVLLHGVTGSGKTEVYNELISRWIADGKSVLFLCPEVSLARQMYQRLARYFDGRILMGSWHSQSLATERRKVWQWVCEGKPCLIVGVHVPVLMPMANLGGIIIDEEHEAGYEEMSGARINTKHAALLRAQHYNIPVVLGSATPSVSTQYVARQHNWTVCRLTKRFGGAMPNVEHVVLSNKEKRPNFWISKQLLDALKDALFRGEQAVVFLNRRGFSFFMQCSGCGHIYECGNCAVSLTVHSVEHAGGSEQELHCHYCDYRRPMPVQCETCSTPTRDGQYKGIGTQQLVTILKKLLPEARIARADTDVSRRKKEWSTTLEQFEAGEIDILVGTQIIAKGFHFPAVTVVGVVWGDASVHFPHYSAHEQALQQLIQVAGRAGRERQNSRVLVQSFDDHAVFEYISEEKYEQFCTQELELRSDLGYPPFRRMATIQLASSDRRVLEKEAHALARVLREKGSSCQVLGPAAPLIERIRGEFFMTILCKAESFAALHALLQPALWEKYTSTVLVHPEV